MKNILTLSLVLVVAMIFLVSGPALAADCDDCNVCTKTAKIAAKACKYEAKDDFWIAIGNCKNLFDEEAREECLETAYEEYDETREECRDQKSARRDICDELGEAPYDPIIDPEDFVDFEEVIEEEVKFTPNQYFPLLPGTVWEYEAKDAEDEVIERIEVEVLDETVEILGVNCIVVRDRVYEVDEEEEETLIEDTHDWYGQDLAGNVWYFGEIALNFEDGELVDIEGSWKAGREYAKAGIIMLADPQVGDIYRQEYSLGDAEDMGRVVSRDEETVSVPFGTYDTDVLVTEDFTPIEPDVLEFKYYAPGVGVVLEVALEDEEMVELVDMTIP